MYLFTVRFDPGTIGCVVLYVCVRPVHWRLLTFLLRVCVTVSSTITVRYYSRLRLRRHTFAKRRLRMESSPT